MLQRVVTLIALVAVLNMSCMHNVKMSGESLRDRKATITQVSFTNGQVMKFDEHAGTYFPDDRLIMGAGLVPESVGDVTGQVDEESEFKLVAKPVIVGMDSVLQVWVKKTDVVGTVLTVMVVGAIMVGIIVAIAEDDDDYTPPPSSGTQSCPFIYAYDGNQYVFNAEPLGGAVCKGLQRTDYSRLESARVTDGEYRIRVRNENPEVQYLDQLQLLTVDHQPGKTVVPDTSGNMHVISNAVTAARAVDEVGRDLTPFLSASDGLAWQTQMSDSLTLSRPDTRHHLSFTFPKPVDARKARLVVNTGTAAWGSMMIREMLDLRGSSVDQWYTAMSTGTQAPLQLLLLNLREELYLLKLYVDKAGVPVERSLLFGGGPFATEDRVVEFDISDIPGDSLTITLNPPKGYWAIDYLAVEYDREATASVQYASVLSAKNQTGEDVAIQLSSTDGSYYRMPLMTDWAEIRFAVPPEADGMDRAVFVRTTGYYELILDKSEPEQQELVNQLLNEPGAIARYSLDKWQEVRQAAK